MSSFLWTATILIILSASSFAGEDPWSRVEDWAQLPKGCTPQPRWG